MSVLVKNVLYIGKNVELVKALLATLVDDDKNISYNIESQLCSNHILDLLDEKKYHYFISEQAVVKVTKNKIKSLFPALKTTYLSTSQPVNESIVVPSKLDLMNDEVKKVLNHVSIPIYYKDKDDKFLMCNRSFADNFGLNVDDVIGKSSSEILPKHLLHEMARIDEKMFKDRQVQLYECELHDANGELREVVIRKELIALTDIQIGIVFDVSELNEARRTIEKDHIMLRATTDISPDLIFFKDLESRFLGCNKQFEKFIGQPEKNILGKKDEMFFEYEQVQMCQQQDQDVMLNNEVYSGEECLIYVDGESHVIDMKKVPLLDNKGKVRGLIGIGRDITAHNRLQKRLKVANAVFENSQENIVVTDQTGKIISINNSACQLFGYEKNELLGQPVRTLSTYEPSAMLYQKLVDKIETGSIWQGDISYRNKLGEVGFAWLDIYVVELEKGVTNHIYSVTDLSQNKNTESKIKFLSKHDPLTGLSNRIALFAKLEDAIHRANFNESTMAVLLIDINGFKMINDQYGHNAGDKVLQEIAYRLKNCVAEKDTLARFGDDEFVIIVDALKNEHDAAIVAKKVLEQFNFEFEIENIEVKLSVAIGISLSPDDGLDVDALLQNAEKAMLRAKSDKNVSYRFYTDQLTKHSSYQLQLEEELKIALDNDQFELYYQPQYDLNKKLIVGMESLWRWNHPVHGVIFPDRFLSLAEESGLIIPLGLKMLEKVALQTISWRKSNIFFGRIAFYLSYKQLEQISLIADLQAIIKDTGCLVSDIEFEIYESVFTSDSYAVHENLFNINKLGIAITVVEFGADIPIFHFIEPLSIEKFKIADDYIRHIPGRIVSQAMIKSIQVLTRELGADIVGSMVDCIEQEEIINYPQKSLQNNTQSIPMKVSEATFYLRCHKRK